ncbi:T9SS type A sorting domain-containing protein [bacterium]|nr:T9SS type A sorting domain-containing protein [bacterium]
MKLSKETLILTVILLVSTTDFVFGSTYHVTNLADDTNSGSLRWAINQANSNPGADEIIFDISGIIQLNSLLPHLENDGTTIDASSQWIGSWPGGEPGITIQGDGSEEIDKGIVIWEANDCYIRGLYIINFSNTGIEISNNSKFNIIGGSNPGYRNVISGNHGGVYILGAGTDENVIQGNLIGTDPTGTIDMGNGPHGDAIQISEGAQSNIIGGANAGERNVISGNMYGIRITGNGTDWNRVIGNLIGTDITGTVALNQGMDHSEWQTHGIQIVEGAQNNTIGGPTEGERNILSGNLGSIIISEAGTMNNKVINNYIGVDISGTQVIGNPDLGICIRNGAHNNIIGGTTATEGNIISGNGRGIVFQDNSTQNNILLSNYIGTDVTGTINLGNTGNGIEVSSGANSNLIGELGAGNIIAFNGSNGVLINNAQYIRIQGNSMHSNGELGIQLENGGNDEISSPILTNLVLSGTLLSVAGTDAGANAVVEIFKADSYKSGEGMTYLGSLTSDIAGLFSGELDVSGKGVSNGDAIVATTTHTDNNTSEFSTALFIQDLYNDYIVDNLGDGDNGTPYTPFDGTNTLRKCLRLSNNNPEQNTITFSVTGIIYLLTSLPQITDDGTTIDASSQWIGSWPGGQPGITLDGQNINTTIEEAYGLVISGSNNSHIHGLFITNFSHSGIRIKDGAKSNVIGGTMNGFRNVVSGNGGGIQIFGNGTDDNQIINNLVGTDFSGEESIGNSVGVIIHDGAKGNVVGGSGLNEGNVISGNHYGIRLENPGTDNNVIIGNLLGTDITGTVALERFHSGSGSRQADGVHIGWEAKNNIIGGINSGERNVISGNDIGVAIRDYGTTGNITTGNFIGVDITGTSTLYNGLGIAVWGGAQSNIFTNNVITGEEGGAIEFNGWDFGGIPDVDYTAFNVISNNDIGTDITQMMNLGGSGPGIKIHSGAHSNIIGPGNIIAHMGCDGIVVENINSDNNKISMNSVYNNNGLGINLSDGGNDEIPSPILTNVSLLGTKLIIDGIGTGTNAAVEFFKADSYESGEGMTYLGSLTSDIAGLFSGELDVTGKGVSNGDPIVATTTHTDNNTSEFCLPFLTLIHINVGMNLYHSGIYGTGEGIPEEMTYTFEVWMSHDGSLSNITPSEVRLTVDGQVIPIDVIYHGSPTLVFANAHCTGIPSYGAYEVAVIDENGDPITNVASIGLLEDYPKDAPEMIYPAHGQVISDLEMFEWENFQSIYINNPFPITFYEFDLQFPDHSFIEYTSGSDVTHLDYSVLVESGAPPDLPEGTYFLGLITFHNNIINNIAFAHSRRISFEVISGESTPIGTDVEVAFDNGTTLNFATVSVEGVTTLEELNEGPPLPSGFEIVPLDPPIYYDITTTATYTGPIIIQINYDEFEIGEVNEADLRLFHYEDGTPVDITTSVDTDLNIIYGETMSLSLFGLAVFVSEPPVEAIENVIAIIENLDLHHGTENSLIIKLNNAIKSLQKGNDNAAVNQLNAFINEVEVQIGKKISERNADNLIFYAESIINAIQGGLEKGSEQHIAKAEVPEQFALFQNVPNPFNPETTISYDNPEEVDVTVTIYNMMGVEVKTLFNGKQNVGYHIVIWDGKDQSGRTVSGGIYICRIQAGTYNSTIKMMLLK